MLYTSDPEYRQGFHVSGPKPVSESDYGRRTLLGVGIRRNDDYSARDEEHNRREFEAMDNRRDDSYCPIGLLVTTLTAKCYLPSLNQGIHIGSQSTSYQLKLQAPIKRGWIGHRMLFSRTQKPLNKKDIAYIAVGDYGANKIHPYYGVNSTFI